MNELERYIEEHSSAGTKSDNALMAELDRATNQRAVHPQMASGRAQGAFLTLITKMLRPRLVLEIGTFTGYSALSIAAGLDDDDESAEIHTVEIDDELEDIARSFFDRSPHGRRIHLQIGSALEVVPQLVGPKPSKTFDLVFIDGDKREYPDYYRMIMGDGGTPPMVRSGTIILTDNVLWYGKVVGQNPDAVIGAPPSVETDGNDTKRISSHRRLKPEDGATAFGPSVKTDGNQSADFSFHRRLKSPDKHTAGIVEFNRMVAADPRVENVILPLRDGINLIRVK